MQEIRKQFLFRVLGEVKAKQSVKFANMGDYMKKYTPKDVINYANWVRTCFINDYPEHKASDLEGYYLRMDIYVYMKYPQAIAKSPNKKRLADDLILRPAKKPDWDNISKNICDALNGVAYPDDKAIVDGSVHKYYGADDFVNVVLTAFKWE